MTLTWFERHPYLHAYRVNGHFAPYAVLARDVRFSDAELAAEFEAARCDALVARENGTGSYWAPLGDSWKNDVMSAQRRALVLLRFATAEHFDENQST